jgi:hypothetical protein
MRRAGPVTCWSCAGEEGSRWEAHGQRPGDRGLVTRMRSLAPHIGWASAVLLWLAGAYVVYYWLIAIRLL